MRIHSSSLTAIPASPGRQPIGKQNSSQNKDELKGLAFSSDYQGSKSAVPPSNAPENITTPPAITESRHLLNKDENTATTSNSRILKALTAYSDEFNKPLLEQNARISKSLDIYA